VSFWQDDVTNIVAYFKKLVQSIVTTLPQTNIMCGKGARHFEVVMLREISASVSRVFVMSTLCADVRPIVNVCLSAAAISGLRERSLHRVPGSISVRCPTRMQQRSPHSRRTNIGKLLAAYTRVENTFWTKLIVVSVICSISRKRHAGGPQHRSEFHRATFTHFF
jgi:hypothetical protein